MADLIGAVTKVTSNFLEINQVSIDNWGFKLFYKATTVYLILSSVLTTAKYEVKYSYMIDIVFSCENNSRNQIKCWP